MVGPARNYAYRHGNRGEPLTLPTASNTTLTAANGVGVGELTDGAGLTVMGKGYETIGIYRSADDSLVPVASKAAPLTRASSITRPTTRRHGQARISPTSTSRTVEVRTARSITNGQVTIGAEPLVLIAPSTNS
jgi:hypothetical protein